MSIGSKAPLPCKFSSDDWCVLNCDVVVGLKDREFGEVWVELDGERRSEYPRSFTKVNMVYHVEGDVPEKLVRRTIKKSHEKYCSVSNSLSREIEIAWELILHDK